MNERDDTSLFPSAPWVLFLLPVAALALLGLFLHPADPADSLQLLVAEPVAFLLSAGPVSQVLLSASGIVMTLLVAGFSLMWLCKGMRGLRYHRARAMPARPGPAIP